MSAAAAGIAAELWGRLDKAGADKAGLVPTGLIERELSPEYESLTAFKAAVYSRYQHAKHLALLDQYLEQVARYVETGGREGIGRLIIAMPPRHGKTLTVSKLFTAWYLGRNPAHRVMAVSYGQGLANKNSRFARNLIRSQAYRGIFPYTTLAQGSRSVQSWDIEDTSGEGGMEALGIGGGAAGKGAHILVMDDLVKNRKQAESITYRNNTWDAIHDDLLTRLAPGGAVILMATRWHQDDPTGRFLKQEADKWTILNLPALAIEHDALGRAVDEALWPERFDEANLLEKKRSLGPYGWTSLYQQDPKPSEGGILKKAWFAPYVRTIPETVRIVRYWDLAMSSKTGADYTVGLKMALGKDGQHYIIDIVREQVELSDLTKLLADVMLADGVGVMQGLESAGYMTRAIQAVAKDPRLAKHIIKGYPAHNDKLTRVLPFASRAALSLIRVKAERWADAYIDELAAFPNGAHDDQVDASSGAWDMINEEPRKAPSGGSVPWAY